MSNLETPPCVCCGRRIEFRRNQPRGGKAGRLPHKCPHGTWCWSGDPFARAGGWNPGGVLHSIRCPTCAEIMRKAGLTGGPANPKAAGRASGGEECST